MAEENRPPEPEPIPEKFRADIDLDSYDWEELDPPEWITDLDREILALLGNSGLIMTPSIIAKNTDRSRSSVSRRLNTLEAGEMVEKVERGHYKISDEGYARMLQKLRWKDEESDTEWVSNRILSPDELAEQERDS